jgi:hypothetical protein
MSRERTIVHNPYRISANRIESNTTHKCHLQRCRQPATGNSLPIDAASAKKTLLFLLVLGSLRLLWGLLLLRV